MLELPLAEVGELQAAKEDAIFELAVDTAALRGREDALEGVALTLPPDNEDFPGLALHNSVPCVHCVLRWLA